MSKKYSFLAFPIFVGLVLLFQNCAQEGVNQSSPGNEEVESIKLGSSGIRVFNFSKGISDCSSDEALFHIQVQGGSDLTTCLEFEIPGRDSSPPCTTTQFVKLSTLSGWKLDSANSRWTYREALQGHWLFVPGRYRFLFAESGAPASTASSIGLTLANPTMTGNCFVSPTKASWVDTNVARFRQAGGSVSQYKIIKRGESRQVAAPFASWQGTIALPAGTKMPAGAVGAQLRFEFLSQNYFSSANIGHFTIGIRGEALLDANNDGQTDLQGRGIIIGNVSAMSPYGTRCGPTPLTNTIAIESYRAGGNCVYGSQTAGPSLMDGVRYRITIRSENSSAGIKAEYISYLLERQDGGQWSPLLVKRIADDYVASVSPDLGSWWIAEVFSQHDWQVDLTNVEWGYY